MTSKKLWDAAHDGRNDIVKSLLKEGNVDVDSKDEDGWTALHWAARNGHDDVVQTLLENQATVNAKDNSGSTPLFWAACKVRNTVVDVARGEQCVRREAANNGRTRLHMACDYNHVHGVCWLSLPLAQTCTQGATTT